MEDQTKKTCLAEECENLDEELEREFAYEILIGESFGSDENYGPVSENQNRGTDK